MDLEALEEKLLDKLNPEDVALKVKLEQDLLRAQIRQSVAEAQRMEMMVKDAKATNEYNRHLIIDGIILDTEDYRATLMRWSRRDPGKPITITINTPGGSVFDGNALLGTIKQVQHAGNPVTIIGSGTLMSYGMILLQAADHRKIEKDCVCMLHGIAAPSVEGGVQQILDVAKMMEEVQERLLDAVAARSTLSKRKIKNMIDRKDAFLTAEQCLEYGFCDEVV